MFPLKFMHHTLTKLALTHPAQLCDVVPEEKFKGYINRIYDGVEAETRKSQASFQII